MGGKSYGEGVEPRPFAAVAIFFIIALVMGITIHFTVKATKSRIYNKASYEVVFTNGDEADITLQCNCDARKAYLKGGELRLNGTTVANGVRTYQLIEK